MVFGLRNAAQTFQCLIDDKVYGLDFVFPHLNDVIVTSISVEVHLAHLRQVFEIYSDKGLVFNIGKCQLG